MDGWEWKQTVATLFKIHVLCALHRNATSATYWSGSTRERESNRRLLLCCNIRQGPHVCFRCNSLDTIKREVKLSSSNLLISNYTNMFAKRHKKAESNSLTDCLLTGRYTEPTVNDFRWYWGCCKSVCLRTQLSPDIAVIKPPPPPLRTISRPQSRHDLAANFLNTDFYSMSLLLAFPREL